jgi:hypothetical protein
VRLSRQLLAAIAVALLTVGVLVARSLVGSGGAIVVSPVPVTPTAPSFLETYRAESSQYVQILGSAMDALAILLDDPRSNDPVWRQAMLTQLDHIHEAYHGLGAINVIPPEMRSFHASLMLAVRQCNDAAAVTSEAINDRDAAEFEQGTRLFSECNKKLSEVAGSVQR